MVAKATRCGAAARVVLHAVALKDFHATVVHHDGKMNDYLALGIRKDLMEAGIQVEVFGGHGKLLARHVKNVNMLTHKDDSVLLV